MTSELDQAHGLFEAEMLNTLADALFGDEGFGLFAINLRGLGRLGGVAFCFQTGGDVGEHRVEHSRKLWLRKGSRCICHGLSLKQTIERRRRGLGRFTDAMTIGCAARRKDGPGLRAALGTTGCDRTVNRRSLMPGIDMRSQVGARC